MTGLFLTLLLLLVGPATRAQAPAWQSASTVVNSTANGTNLGYAAIPDAAGNLYLLGSFSGTLAFAATTLTSTGTSDLYLAKWNRTTNSFAWAIRMGGTGDTGGNTLLVNGTSLYLAGSFTGTSTTIGTTTLPNSGSSSTRDSFITKLTDTGTTATIGWIKQISGSGDEQPYGMALATGGVYLSGYFTSPTLSLGTAVLTNAGFADVFVTRLTDAGTTASFAWGVRAGGAGDDMPAQVLASGNTLYLAGTYSAPATFGSDVLTGVGFPDIFVSKLTDLGTSASYVWTQKLTGTGGKAVQSIALSGSNLYVVGEFSSPTLTVGTTTLTNAGSYDILVAKLTDAGSTGTWAWAKSVGSPFYDIASMVVASGNKVYVTGSFGYPISGTASSTATFGTTTFTTFGGSDAYLTRLTDAGATASFDWTQRMGGPDNDQGYGVALSGTTVYATGVFNSTSIGFGNFTLTNPRVGTAAPYLASIADVALPVRTAALPAGFALYPNPAHGTTTVSVPGGATLVLLDALGRVVRTATAPAGVDYPLDLTGLAPGVYALRMQAGETQAVQRLVVE